MLLIGILFFLISLTYFIIVNTWVDNHIPASKIGRFFLAAVMIVGVLLIGIDGIYPTEMISERIIQTTDYEAYGVPILSERAGLILEVKFGPKHNFILSGRRTEYIFLDWVER